LILFQRSDIHTLQIIVFHLIVKRINNSILSSITPVILFLGGIVLVVLVSSVLVSALEIVSLVSVVESVVVSHLVVSVSVHHVWPRILVVWIPTTNINCVILIPVDARNERNPEHFQLRCKVQNLIGHYSVKITILPRHTLHGAGTLGERLLLSRNKVTLLLILSGSRLLNWSWLLLNWSWLLLNRSRLLLNRSRLLLHWLVRYSWILFDRLWPLLHRSRLLLYGSLLYRLWLLLHWSSLSLLDRPRVGWLDRSDRTCSLADIGAPVKTAECIADAINIRLAYTPAVRLPSLALFNRRNVVDSRTRALVL